MKAPQLQQQELLYLQDTEFLSAKLRIQDKLRLLLQQCQQGISAHKATINLPPWVWEVPAKISRGENYEGLPYQVLDYPRIFRQETTFAYRCMFWWGWGFSCTLHLGGQYWKEHQATILSKLGQLPQGPWWVCVNSSPWEYHYRPDNYLHLEDMQEDLLPALASNHFFKISGRLPLASHAQLPAFSLQTLQQLAQLVVA